MAFLVYTRILVPLENSPTDAAILAHVCRLARLAGARLRESEELKKVRAYLDATSAKLAADLIYGSVANEVRHRSLVPVLMARAGGELAPPAA